jgi:tRNA 2-thiouridine synthesizing protein E
MVAVSRQYARPQAPQPPAIQFDAEGFVVDPCNWTAETSRVIAELDGVGPLGVDHWRMIWHLRARYLVGCSLLGVRHLSEDCQARDSVRELFGSCRQAWRVAGLPDPGPEAKAVME